MINIKVSMLNINLTPMDIQIWQDNMQGLVILIEILTN